MICKNCSKEFYGKFCPECGAPAEQEPVVEQNFAESEPIQEAAPIEEAVYAEPVPVAPEAEGDYYQPTEDYGGAYSEPKKKGKKKAIIIISIILAVLIAAFCVVSFTDLVFTKKAQFGSILKNMGADCDVQLDKIDSDYVETTYSVKVSEDMADLFAVSSDEMKEVVDLLESVNFSVKQYLGEGDYKAIWAAYEDDIKLLDIQTLMTKDAAYGKLGFSDLVFKVPLPYDMTNLRAKAQKISELITNEFTEAVESNEFEKGEYDGYFDLDMDVKTITFTMDDDEIISLLEDVVDGSFDVLGIDSIENPDFDELTFDGEVRVSALYTGAFSYARKALGVSIMIDVEGEEVEFLYFSNKEDKAIYGVSADDAEVFLIDNFEISGDTQSGNITFGGFSVESIADELEALSLKYTRSRNNLQVNASFLDGADVYGVTFNYEVTDGSVASSLGVELNSKELAVLNMTISPCDAFDVNIDTSDAIDITGTFDEDEVAAQLEEEALAWIESNDEGVVFGLLNELVEAYKVSALEQYMLDEFDIEFTQTEFETANRSSFVYEALSAGVIDVQEVGYENDVIKELVETVYYDLSDYTYSQQKMVLNNLKDSFDEYDIEGFEYECTLEDDYVIMIIKCHNMDNSEKLAAYKEAGLIGVDASGGVLYYEECAETMVDNGYIEVE